MVLVVIPPFSGFLKALLNPKSMLSLIFYSQANLLLLEFSKRWWMIVFLFNRYEGARNAEALAEYVNKEGGTLLDDSLAKLVQTYFCFLRRFV